MSAPAGPRFISVGVKLAFATVTVLALVTALIVYELTARERESVLTSKTVAAGMVADLLAASLVPSLDFRDKEEVEVELQSLRSNRDLLFAAVWITGAPEPIAILRGQDPAATIVRPS